MVPWWLPVDLPNISANTDCFEAWLVSIERSFQGLSVAVKTVKIVEELVEIWSNEVCDTNSFRIQYSLNFKVDEDVYPLLVSNGLTVHCHTFIWPHFTDLWYCPCWFWLSSVYSGVQLYSLNGKLFACWFLSLWSSCLFLGCIICPTHSHIFSVLGG